MLSPHTRTSLIRSLILCVGAAAAVPAMAQVGTSFTYQGQLDVGGAPATGIYDLQFGLFSAATGGAPLATSCVSDVSVVDGLLMATVEFGALSSFATQNLFVGERVREDAANIACDFNNPSFTTLVARQRLSAAPIAAQLRNVFVDSLGRVGINGSSPLARLDLQGGAEHAGAQSARLPLHRDPARDQSDQLGSLLWRHEALHSLGRQRQHSPHQLEQRRRRRATQRLPRHDRPGLAEPRVLRS